ncbi:MAG TPA: M28 family peptidase [bacterium]|nr:M28 family peptidase [bacterium]
MKVFLVISAAFFLMFMVSCPGKKVPPITVNIPADSAKLKAHVEYLAGLIPTRSSNNEKSHEAAAKYIEGQFAGVGCAVTMQRYTIDAGEFRNIICRYGVSDAPRIIVGAHYDTVRTTPGADDNASAVAGLLEIARLLNQLKPTVKYPLELIAYDLEEPPYYNTKHMGSYRHAEKLSSDEEKVHFMISLEMIGYFSDDSGSQKYPSSFLKLIYPSTGNFILVTGIDGEVLDLFREAFPQASKVPLETFEYRIDLSDHMNYRDLGYRAVMVTDTAFYRNPNYHEPTDTPDTLDYARMAEVVKGVYLTVTSVE